MSFEVVFLFQNLIGSTVCLYESVLCVLDVCFQFVFSMCIVRPHCAYLLSVLIARPHWACLMYLFNFGPQCTFSMSVHVPIVRSQYKFLSHGLRLRSRNFCLCFRFCVLNMLSHLRIQCCVRLLIFVLKIIAAGYS